MRTLLLIALALISSADVRAEDSSSAAMPSTSRGSIYDFVPKNVYTTFFTTYHGAPISDISSKRAIDRNGNQSKSALVNLDSELGMGYKITDRFGAGLVVPFLLFPEGDSFVLGDVGVKALDHHTISTEHFNLSTNLIVQAPTSDSSKARNMKYAVKTTPSMRYTFGESNFSAGAFTEAKYYAGVTTDKLVKLFAEPYVSYRLNRKLALNLAYEMEWHHNVGQKGAKFGSYQKDIQPGLIWNISKKVMLNPYAQIFPTNNSIAWKTTAVGAVMSASIL